MKDIEKIKSEDLGCQVQDANPGNFAIEQEVGAMVGATVPAPTAPSADDARELGAQLLVFLRRALLPIKSALRTALADIYAHLDSRCTDYTPAGYFPASLRPYDPMGSTPRTLPNLLTAITAFAPRKISNGSAPNDGIPDGTSLAQVICNGSSVVEIKDDNTDWAMTKALSGFPNLKKATILAKTIYYNVINGMPVEYLDLGTHRAIDITNPSYAPGIVNSDTAEELTIRIKNLRYKCPGGECGFITRCNNLKKLTFEDCEDLDIDRLFYIPTPQITHFKASSLKRWNTTSRLWYAMDNLTDLIDLEVGEMETSFNLSWWTATNVLADADKTATFLQNFLEHICQKLANRTGQSKLTLTLSAAVYTAIMTSTDIKAELVARNWKVTDGTNNFNN